MLPGTFEVRHANGWLLPSIPGILDGMEPVAPVELEGTPAVEGGQAVVRYRVHDVWRVEISAQVHVPWDGPERVEIVFVAGADNATEAVASVDPNGITTAILRAVPLADARVRLRRLRAQARLSSEVAGLPPKLRTEWEWAEFSRLYVLAAEVGGQPLADLEAVTGVGRRTLDSRARQAREKRLLTKPTKDSLGKLTPKAQRLLAKGRTE